MTVVLRDLTEIDPLIAENLRILAYELDSLGAGGIGLGSVVDDTTPQLGGTLDANGNSIDMGVNLITDASVGNWNTAFGWGDHSGEGYLTSVVAANVNTEAAADGHVLTSNGSGNAVWEAVPSAPTQLSDLNDVGTVGYTARHVLIADGGNYDSRALVEADISDLGSYITAEVNDLTAAVTWANVPDANITQSSVTQHEAALSIAESQIADGSIFPRRTTNETIPGIWTLDGAVTGSGFGTGGKVKDGSDTAQPIGFNVMPIYEIDVSDTFDLAHNGMLWHRDAASGAHTYTVPNDSTIPAGATYVIVNESSFGSLDIGPASGVTLVHMEGTTRTNITNPSTLSLDVGAIATVVKYTDTKWFIWGVGLS